MDKKKLLEGLNQDLADELATICRYIQQAAMPGGITGHEVRGFVKAEVVNEVNHALFLADTIVALGGRPEWWWMKPAAFKVLADPKAMLEHDLELEREAIKNYTERVQQAEAAGEIDLKVRLEHIIADETHHAEEIVNLLGRWEIEAAPRTLGTESDEELPAGPGRPVHAGVTGPGETRGAVRGAHPSLV